jgi:protoporphyrinogen oxidase
MDKLSKNTIIIGSGLSGLSCAFYLKKKGIDVKVYERYKRPGGRVNSELKDGYILDIGFQVLLNNYDELKKMDIYKKLSLNYFDSGAEIFSDNQILNIYNPLFHPYKFLKSNFFRIFNMRDLFSFFHLFLIKDKDKKLNAGNYLKKYFSGKSLKYFFYPFFRGVFLSKNLNVNLFFFLKIIKKFAFGKAGLPANGMMDIPSQIIKSANLNILYDHNLIKIDKNTAYFENGTKVKYDNIVLALPLEEIKKLTELNCNAYNNQNLTCYIKSKKNVLKKSILLISDNKYETNSIQCLSNISCKYTKNGDHLYSLSSLNYEMTVDRIIDEFAKITKIKKDDFSLIKVYRIKSALPRFREFVKQKGNMYFCGDWSTEPSIDGAIKSGRLIAENITRE